MLSHELINPVSASIIKLYRTVSGPYDLLWKEIEVRTNGCAWREDGVGSCGIGKALSEKGIEGPAKADMIRLHGLRNAQTPGESKYCPNHRVGKGCDLGDLKSPLCLGFIDPGLFDEIPLRFGDEVLETLLDLQRDLYRIFLGADTGRAIQHIQNLMKVIQTFPILHPEEVK